MSIPFLPIVYEHAAALIGRRPWEVSRDAGLLAAAHREAHRQYGHTLVVAGIDVYNVEAEAYGAVVEDPGGNGVPFIGTHPCRTMDDVLGLPPPDTSHDGRFPLVLDAAHQLRGSCGGATVAVPLSGPFSIASGLLGFEELLMAVLTEPAATAQALCHLAEHQGMVARAVLAAGIDVVFFESSATPPLLSPAQFRDVACPALRLLGEAHGLATPHPFTLVIGGNTLPILEMILESGAGSIICPSETDQEEFMKTMRSHPGVRVRVNMQPGVFAASSPCAALAEASRVAPLARGREHACIGTGVLPYESDPSIVLQVQEFFRERTS